MSIEDTITEASKDIDIIENKEGIDIIKSNIVEVNTSAKKEYLSIAKIRDKLLKRLDELIDDLPFDKLLKLYEKLANIGLTQIELNNDLVNPKSNNPSVILQNNVKDEVKDFTKTLTTEDLKSLEMLTKLFQSNISEE